MTFNLKIEPNCTAKHPNSGREEKLCSITPRLPLSRSVPRLIEDALKRY